MHLKKQKGSAASFQGRTPIGQLCVVLAASVGVPQSICLLGSSLSKELSRKQSFHAIHSISVRQHGKAVTCMCSFMSICKMFYRLLQENQRLKSAGEFSHLYLSWIYSPLSVMEQSVLFGPISVLVLSVLCCWPVSAFPPDDPLL